MKLLVFVSLLFLSLLSLPALAQVQQVLVPYTLADRDRAILNGAKIDALEQIKIRGLNETILEDVLNSPDKVMTHIEGMGIYQKLVIENNKRYLYRVFVNINKEPPMVITAYKTTKVDKYENPI